MKFTIIKISAVVALVVVLLSLGVGYAAVSKDLKANAEVDGNTQDKVFITDFALKGDPTGATPQGTSYLGSLLSSNVNVGKGESKTYNVTVYNSADEAYYYVDTLYDTTLGYDNTNVSFKLSIAEGDWIDCADQETFEGATSIVLPGRSLTFEITFTHNGSDATSVLNSVLNFMFKPVEEIQIASLIYNGQTYRDQFLRSETVAKFPEVPIDIAYNMARCNNDTTPVLENGYIKITGIDWESKNQDNSVKCKIYKTLTGSMRDKYFENSDYTINNFIAFKSFEDKGDGAKIPTNKEWNIYLGSHTVTYNKRATYNATDAEDSDFVRGDSYKMMYFENKSVVNIIANASGGINCGTSSASNPIGTNNPARATLAKLTNTNSTLTLTGGKYTCNGYGDIIYIAAGGKVVCRDVTMQNWGNIFRTGLEPTAEKVLSGDNVAGNNYTIHLEILGTMGNNWSSTTNITSVTGNIVHNTSRQNLLCNIAGVKLTAEVSNVILSNNKGTVTADTEPAMAVWENNRFYVTNSAFYCPYRDGVADADNKYHFYTHGARMYYTETLRCTSATSALGLKSYGRIDDGYHMRDFRVKNYTSSTAEDWYYVKDASGNRIKDSNGIEIKVGDPVKISSTATQTLVWDIYGGLSNATVGGNSATVLQVYSSNNSAAQRWRFIAADGENKYHIGNYDKPTVIAYSKYAGQGNAERVDLQLLTELYIYEASRFTLTDAEDGFYISYYHTDHHRRVEIYGNIQSGAKLAVRQATDYDSNGTDTRHNRRSWTLTVSTAN